MANSDITNGSSIKICMSLASIVIPWNYHVLFAISYVLLSIVTIFSNTILIYTLYKTKQFNTISNKLILVMNISDLCAGVLALPTLSATHVIHDFHRRCESEKLANFLAALFGYFSFLMLCCISLDRYFQVTKLNRYNSYVNEFRMKIVILSFIAVSFSTSLKLLLNPSFRQKVITASLGLFGLSFVILMYMFLLKRLRNHAAAQSNNTIGEISTRAKRNSGSQLSAAKTIQFLLIYLAITYIPHFAISSWWAYYKYWKKTEPGFYLSVIYTCTSFLALFNASGNSWIIIYGNGRSRRFVSSLFRRNRVENAAENRISNQLIVM